MALETVTLQVAGMTCGNCVRTVERKLLAHPGVSSVKVDLAAATAIVQFQPGKTNVPDLVAAVNSLGYEASV